MTARKGRPVIGARLSGLVAGVDALAQPASTTLPLADLRPGAFQPRVQFDEVALADLSCSIREQGVLQPLLVRPLAVGGYEIVAGERRWRAAAQAGLSEVPVLIRDLDDTQARLAAAVENLQRENLNVLEEVRARLQVAAATLGVPETEAVARMFALDRQPELDAEGVARLDTTFAALGRETWRSFIRNRAAVLNLPEDVQAAVRAGLDHRKALVIGRLTDHEARAALLLQAQAGATVQELRTLVTPARPDAGWQLLGRRLSQKRTLESLDAGRRKKIEKLLGQIQTLLDEE